MVPVWEQFQSFFFTVVIGLLIGVVVDGYRGFNRFVRLRPLIISLGDLVLWLFLAGLVFFLLLLNNWGEMRAYVLIGITTGILLYRQWCSSFILSFWRRFFLTLRWAYVLIQKILFLPLGLIRMLGDWLWRLMVALGSSLPKKWWRNKGR